VVIMTPSTRSSLAASSDVQVQHLKKALQDIRLRDPSLGIEQRVQQALLVVNQQAS